MRVTQSQMYRQTLASINQSQTQVVRYQDSLSSGVRLRQAADDPSAMTQAMRNDDRRAELTRLDENMRRLEGRYGVIEHELDALTDRLHRARELVINGANASYSPESLEILAQEMRGLGEDVQAIANARDGQGRYVFAGNLDGAAAFSGSFPTMSYEGGSSARQVNIGDDFSLPDGLAGDAVFLNGPAGDMFAMFEDLAAALEAPTSTTRNTDLDNGLDALAGTLDHVLGFRAQLGQDMQRIEGQRERMEALDVELQSHSSALRDTDFPATVAAMSIELTSLEAARRTFSQIQSLSLFDYLR